MATVEYKGVRRKRGVTSMNVWKSKSGGPEYPIVFWFMKELRIFMLLLISGSYLFKDHGAEGWKMGFVVAAMCIFLADHFLHFSHKTTKYCIWWTGIDFFVSALFGIVFPLSTIYQINFGIAGVTLILFTDTKRILLPGTILLTVVWACLWRLNYQAIGHLNFIDTLINLGFVLNSVLVGVMIRFLLKARIKIAEQYEKLDESHQALQEAHEQLRGYAKKVEELTTTRERNHIAREIHDTVGHTMTALVVQLQAARMLQEHDREQSRETLLRCEELARSALQEVRLSVRALRDEDTNHPALIDSLRTLLAEFSNMTGLKTVLRVEGEFSSISTSLQPAIYRIVQESLTNAKRHGNAANAEVSITCTEHQVELSVRDDGQGTGSVTPGFGLINLRERAAEQGGTVQFFSEKGAGFRVQAFFPLQQLMWRYGG